MSGLFGGKPQQQTPAPTVTPQAPMPDNFSAGVLEAKRKAQLDIMARAGRQSTILTAPGNRGNSNQPAYSATKLGSAA